MLQSFYDAIEDQKYYYSDPIYRTFDKFFRIIVLAFQGRQGMLRSHLPYVCHKSLFQFLGSLVLGPMQNKCHGFRASGTTFRVLGFGSHPQDGSRVLGPTKSPGSQVQLFRYALWNIAKWFWEDLRQYKSLLRESSPKFRNIELTLVPSLQIKPRK